MSVFLITGASRGLGRAIVVAALAAGHDVVAGVRDPRSLDDLAQETTGSDATSTNVGELLVVPLDVTDPTAATAAVASAVERFGRLDVLVNNAGYADLASIEDADRNAFVAQIDTNLYGVIDVTRAALPVMRTQASGHVVQVSSVGGRLATPGLGAYQTAKWAVGGFSSVLAQEVGPLGIRVTVLEPGGMRTDWAGSSMHVAPVSPAYEPTVGAAARMHGAGATGASDPAKVAELVLEVVAMDEPPLRLLVGPDAYRYATAAGRALLAEDERLRTLSESTAADDATAEHLDPLGTR